MMEISEDQILIGQQQQFMQCLSNISSQKTYKNNLIQTDDIKCADGNNSQMACTDQKCKPYPFVCKSNSNCQKCHNNHSKCMNFIKLQNFLHQILQKNIIPSEVLKYLNSTVDKWIDMISDTFFSIQNLLKSYGLTKSQQQLLNLIQQKKLDKITGPKIKKVLREIDDQQIFASKQSQLKQVLEIQINKTTDILKKQLQKLNEIVDLARDGKVYQYKAKIVGQGQRWNFDKNYRYASKFILQNDDKMAMKSVQHKMYSHIIGNKKFSNSKTSEFSVLIINSELSFEMFGIGTKKIDREDVHESKNAVMYLSCNGSIWHNGQYQKIGQRLSRDDMVTIRYQPQYRKVTWLKNYKPIATYSLPEYITKYELYPVYSLFSNGDLLSVVDYEE